MKRTWQWLRSRGRRLRFRLRRGYFHTRRHAARIRRKLRYWYSRLPWRVPRETDVEKNTWNLYMDAAWWGIANGVWGTYLTVFAVRLGASTALLGVLAAAPALVNMVWSIPAARSVEAQPRRLPLILQVGLLQRLAWLAVAMLPLFLGSQGSVYAILVIAALSTFPAATSNVAYTNLLADLVPPQDRARVISMRNVLLSATSMATVLIFGAILSSIPSPLNYQIVFGVAFLCSMVSLYYVSRLIVPEAATVAHQARPKHWIAVSVRHFFSQLWQQKGYLKFVAGSLFFNWGVYFPSALYSIYQIRDLGASDAFIGVLAMVGFVVTIVSYLVWGRLIPRLGNRNVMILSAFGMTLFPVATALSRSLPPLLIPAVLGGVFTPGFTLAGFNELLAVCPDENRPRYIGVYTSAVNFAAFIAPLAGSFATGLTNIRLALFVAGAFRIAGALSFVFLIGAGMRGVRELASREWHARIRE